MKKIITVVAVVLIASVSANALILSEKLDVNKKISQANTFIMTKQYDKATELLTDIKFSYSDTEFAPIANFLLAKINYDNKNYFKAQFLIEQAYEHEDFGKLVAGYQDRIRYLLGMVYYKIENYQKSLDILKTLVNKKTLAVDRVYLYICDILVKTNQLSQVQYFFKQINDSHLVGYERDLYNYLADKIMWQSIDTTKIAYKDPNVSALLIDKDVLYIGTWNGSLIYYNYILGEYHYFTNKQIINENIRALYNDGRYIYVGTQEGVSILDKRSQTWFSPDFFNGVSITSFCKCGDKIYVGTLGDGMVEYDPKQNAATNSTKGVLTNVVGISQIDDVVYVMAYNGNVYRYADGALVKDAALSQRQNPVMKIMKCGSSIWLATYGSGVVRYDTVTKKSVTFNKKNSSLGDDFILCAQVYEDRIYFGTLGKGISVYNMSSSSWEMFRFSDKYFGLDINSLLVYNNSIFIGTLGEGVLIKALGEQK